MNFTDFEIYNADLWEALPADLLRDVPHPFASLELIDADLDVVRLAQVYVISKRALVAT